MPLYELRCTECDLELERYAPIQQGKTSTACPCGGLARRIFTPPAIAVGFQPHYNHSVGAYVNSEREFKDHLQRGAEEQMRRLPGTTVDYQPIPIAELAHSEEGLEATRKVRRDTGLDQARKTIIT